MAAVEQATGHLADLTRREGRVSTGLLDRHQEAVYHFGFLAAEGAMANVLVDYAQRGVPMTPEQLNDKVRMLSGEALIGSLDDPDRPASELLQLVVGE